jgi:hypothetical protein
MPCPTESTPMTIRSARRLAIAFALTTSLVTPAVARANVPSYQNRTDAKRFARNYWERRGYYAPCTGVRVRVAALPHNTVGEYRPWNPCTIYLSSTFDWTHGGRRDGWWQVCATTIHEYGHLVGKAWHSNNPGSIMASSLEENRLSWWWPYYPECRYDGDDEDGDGTPDW